MNVRDLLLFTGTLTSLFLSIMVVFALVFSGKQGRAAQDQLRARQMAEHRMNARLLRLNI
jgi:hypothetical protein